MSIHKPDTRAQEQSPDKAPSKTRKVLKKGVVTSGQNLVAQQEQSTGGACPDCGAFMTPESGCWLCRSCGHSHCW